MRIANIIFISALACATMIGCASRSKVGAVGADPDRPEHFAPVPSVVNIPAEITTDYIEKIINDQMSGTLYRSDTFTIGGFSNVRVSVAKNGRVKILARGNELHCKIPLKISMRFSFTISALGLSHTEYQDADAAITISLRSGISLKNNWRLVTATTVDGYTWTSDPVVKVRFITIPIKPVADRIVSKQMGVIGNMVDKSISAGINVKTLVTPLWEKLQTPMEISVPEIPERLWLRFAPTDIYMSQPTGKGGSITASMGIHTVTETFMGDKPATHKPKPLPDFKTPDRSDSAFAINLYSEISFKQATAISRELFVGKTFKSGKQTVTVHDMEIAGTSEGLAQVKMNVSGSLKGTVCVTGKAVYNEPTQTLSIENFDFDVATKSQYHKAKNWLLKGIITAKMKPLMKFPLGKTLDDAKILIQKVLTDYELYDGIVLNGRVDSLTVRGVEVTENGFRVVVLANGTTRVRVREY